jgi:RNA polymerase subunit RPABC4/transcription elongation factor Spt4
MTEEDNSHLAERARKAAKIVADPAQFKVCEGCESIVAARVVICPNCYGYRFNEEEAAVVEQAKLLATREQTSVVAEDLG